MSCGLQGAAMLIIFCESVLCKDFMHVVDEKKLVGKGVNSMICQCLFSYCTVWEGDLMLTSETALLVAGALTGTANSPFRIMPGRA